MKVEKLLSTVLLLGLLIIWGCENATEPGKPPVITEITADPAKVEMSGSATLTCIVTGQKQDKLTYYWKANYGNIEGSDNRVTWIAPGNVEGTCDITCTVQDNNYRRDIESIKIEIEQTALVQLIVPGQANIYGAGKTVLPGSFDETSFDGTGGGVLPTEFRFMEKSGRFLTFPGVTGSLSVGYPFDKSNFGPDGFEITDDYSRAIDYYCGISGIYHDSRRKYLVGVFLNDNEPVSGAPARLEFSGGGEFLEISPKLQQAFFIGDGLTGTGEGEIQKFNIPEKATRLFLGFFAQGSISGTFYYQYMEGELSVSVMLNSK